MRPCNIRRNHSGQGGEDSPPHDSPGQHPARPEAVSQPAAYGLKERITNQKGTEHFAQLHIAEMVGLGDRPAGNRNIYPVEIRHRTENEQPEHQKPSHRLVLAPFIANSPSCRSDGRYDIFALAMKLDLPLEDSFSEYYEKSRSSCSAYMLSSRWPRRPTRNSTSSRKISASNSLRNGMAIVFRMDDRMCRIRCCRA